MTISFIVMTAAQILTLAIIVRAVLSWFPGFRALAPVTTLVQGATDPILRPIQRKLPAVGPFDLSPLVAVLLIGLCESLVLGVVGGR